MEQKNYNYQLSFLLILLVLTSSSCALNPNSIRGDGNMTEVTWEVTDFEAIDASGMFKIYLLEGTSPSLRVETDENLQKYVHVEVHDNTLKLSMDRNHTYNPTRMEVFITTNELKEINMSGATSISADYTLISDNLSLDLSGAGNINLHVDVVTLTTRVSGAGSINISGNADNHHVRLSGAASMSCLDLHTRSTTIHLSGAGSAKVYATDLLDANLSGVGSIRYGGNPQSTQINKSGIGTISPV